MVVRCLVIGYSPCESVVIMGGRQVNSVHVNNACVPVVVLCPVMLCVPVLNEEYPNATIPYESAPCVEKTPLRSDAQEKEISEGISSWSLTVPSKKTDSP